MINGVLEVVWERNVEEFVVIQVREVFKQYKQSGVGDFVEEIVEGQNVERSEGYVYEVLGEKREFDQKFN